MKLDQTTKEIMDTLNSGSRIPLGVHKVKISLINAGVTEKGQDYIEVEVFTENDEIDTARLWFTTPGGAKFSFNIIRAIIMHNTKEEDRAAVGERVDKVDDTDELVKIFSELCMGGECWFTKEESADRTYVDKQGKTRPSIDKGIWSYAPKPKNPAPVQTVDNAPDVPFESAGDAKPNIPSDDDWAGDK